MRTVRPKRVLVLAVAVALLCAPLRQDSRAQAGTPQAVAADSYAERLRAFEEFVGAAVALHPKNAALHEMLGDFLARKGRPDSAAENYRQAYARDPALAKGLLADDYVAGRLKAAAKQKKN